jgi:hypothetical protein
MMQFGFLFRHAGKAEVSTHDALLGRWRRPVGRVEVLWLLERRHGCGCAQTPFDATKEKGKEKVESQHRQANAALLEILREISTRHERGQPCQDQAHPDADGSGPLVSAGRARRPPKIQKQKLGTATHEAGARRKGRASAQCTHGHAGAESIRRHGSARRRARRPSCSAVRYAPPFTTRTTSSLAHQGMLQGTLPPAHLITLSTRWLPPQGTHKTDLSLPLPKEKKQQKTHGKKRGKKKKHPTASNILIVFFAAMRSTDEVRQVCSEEGVDVLVRNVMTN